MVCVVCSKTIKQNDAVDCFEYALESLKQHYIFYRNSLKQRDSELQKFKERNDQLNKAMELLQKNQQQPSKRFKTNHEGLWLPPPNKNNNNNSDHLTDVSLTDEDDGAGASNLNMALNSEQLFETSVLSPARPEASITSSEMVISPRAKILPRRNVQREKAHTLKDRNKLLEKSKSEWHAKEQTNQMETSWAMKFLKQPAVKGAERKVGVDVKPEKKMNLSLKKVNPSKIKQSVLQFNSSKDSSVIESDVCEDIIDASPVVSKNSRAGKSWAHRSGHNHSSHNSPSPTNTNSNNKANLKSDDSSQKLDGTASIPIENIVFDFSPTKKPDITTLDTSASTSKSTTKQLNFNGGTVNDTTTDCVSLSNDQTTMFRSVNNSSVVMLTPATQDIIFLDDTSSDFMDIDTMDLLADIQKHETEYMENLKKYESKNIEKQHKQDLKQQERPLATEERTHFIKPVSTIKIEKKSQDIAEGKKSKYNCENECPSTSNKNAKFQNPLIANDPGDDGEEEAEEEEIIPQPFLVKQEHPHQVASKKLTIKERFNKDCVEEEEDEDVMPQPLIVKQEPKVQSVSKKLTAKERFNIDCDDCENFIRFLGASLTDSEIEEHLRNCTRHKQQDIMRQNTPEGFWNPFIMSFDENDPRNEVLIDTRFRDKQQLGK